MINCLFHWFHRVPKPGLLSVRIVLSGARNKKLTSLMVCYREVNLPIYFGINLDPSEALLDQKGLPDQAPGLEEVFLG